MRAYMILAALLLLPLSAAGAQSPRCAETVYGVGGVGSRCVVGLRASLRDDGYRQVSGIDLSIVNRNPFAGDSGGRRSVVRGATLSLVGADGAELSGVNVGLVYAHGARLLRGVNVGGLAAGGDSGRVQGITAAGIFILAKELTGINVGGVAVVGQRVRGVNVAGAVVHGRRVEGVSASGWSVHGGAGGLTGVQVGLIGAGGEGPVRGITAGGLLVIGERDVSGVAASFLMVRAQELNGVAVSAHNRVRGTQRGLTVGLLNRTRQLRGVQLGLLNEAENNPRLLRWLPLVNVHL